MIIEPVGQVDPTVVDQPQHQHGDEDLGDRADPVLRIRSRRLAGRPAVEEADRVRPGHRAVAHVRRRQRGDPVLGLFHRDHLGQPSRQLSGEAHGAHHVGVGASPTISHWSGTDRPQSEVAHRRRCGPLEAHLPHVAEGQRDPTALWWPGGGRGTRSRRFAPGTGCDHFRPAAGRAESGLQGGTVLLA